jgi:hypothetical protein
MARTFFRGGREGQPEDRHSRVEAESRPRRVSESSGRRTGGRNFRCGSSQKSRGKPVAISVAILADTNVVAAASGTLDDPDVTGMENSDSLPEWRFVFQHRNRARL